MKTGAGVRQDTVLQVCDFVHSDCIEMPNAVTGNTVAATAAKSTVSSSLVYFAHGTHLPELGVPRRLLCALFHPHRRGSKLGLTGSVRSDRAQTRVFVMDSTYTVKFSISLRPELRFGWVGGAPLLESRWETKSTRCYRLS